MRKSTTKAIKDIILSGTLVIIVITILEEIIKN